MRQPALDGIKMKFVLVGPVYPYRGGIAHYTTQLALALQNEGHEVRVISFRRQYPGWLYPGKSDRDPSLSAISIPADFILDPLAPWTWFLAARSIAAGKPDLVIAQWWNTFWALPFGVIYRVLRYYGHSTAALIHNLLPHERKPWDKPLTHWALSANSGFIVQTQSQKESLCSLLPHAHVIECYHPVYTLFFDRHLSQNEARRLLELPKDRLVLLFFGIIRQYKGLKDLLEALSKLPASGRPLLVVAGEFWEDRGQYQHQIEQLQLADDVLIHDRYIPNEQIRTYFSAADLLIAPYVNATQSGAANMALGFGLPMIVSDIVAQGIDPVNLIHAHIFPAGDVDALANVLQVVSESPPKGRFHPPASGEWAHMVAAIRQMAVNSRDNNTL